MNRLLNVVNSSVGLCAFISILELRTNYMYVHINKMLLIMTGLMFSDSIDRINWPVVTKLTVCLYNKIYAKIDDYPGRIALIQV